MASKIMLTERELTAWQRAGELLGRITKQLSPKGVRVILEHNETFDAIEISARVSANGKTWAMNRMLELKLLVNYTYDSDYADEFCHEFLDTFAEHAAEFARERRG